MELGHFILRFTFQPKLVFLIGMVLEKTYLFWSSKQAVCGGGSIVEGNWCVMVPELVELRLGASFQDRVVI